MPELAKYNKELCFDTESKEMEHNGCMDEVESSHTSESILP